MCKFVRDGLRESWMHNEHANFKFELRKFYLESTRSAWCVCMRVSRWNRRTLGTFTVIMETNQGVFLCTFCFVFQHLRRNLLFNYLWQLGAFEQEPKKLLQKSSKQLPSLERKYTRIYAYYWPLFFVEIVSAIYKFASIIIAFFDVFVFQFNLFYVCLIRNGNRRS